MSPSNGQPGVRIRNRQSRKNTLLAAIARMGAGGNEVWIASAFFLFDVLAMLPDIFNRVPARKLHRMYKYRVFREMVQ